MHYGVHSYYDNNQEENGNINNYKRIAKKFYNKEVNIRRKRLENLYDQERILYNRYLIKSGINKRYDYRAFGTVSNLVKHQDVNSMIKEMDLIKQVNNKQISSPINLKNENIYSIPKDSYHLKNKDSNLNNSVLLNSSESKSQTSNENLEIINNNNYLKMINKKITKTNNEDIDNNDFKNHKKEKNTINNSINNNEHSNFTSSENLKDHIDYSSKQKISNNIKNEINYNLKESSNNMNNMDLDKSPLLKGEFKNYGKQNMVFLNPYYENNKLDIFEKKLINYNSKLESLRMQEYNNNKKVQDELLDNINNKLNSINNSISKSMYNNNILSNMNLNNNSNNQDCLPNQFNQLNKIIYNQINSEFSKLGQYKDFRDIGLVNMNSQFLPIIK